MASSSVARCRHRRFQPWMVGVAVSLGGVFASLGGWCSSCGWGGAPMCQAKVLPGLAGAGNVDALCAPRLVLH
jgi:hypothetical protein